MATGGEAMEKSLFITFFGDSPTFKVIDFLLENRLQDFTKTEIAKGALVSIATLFKYWNELETNNIVKVTRQVGRIKLYQLNESEPIVKELKHMEMVLMKRAADIEEEKMKITA